MRFRQRFTKLYILIVLLACTLVGAGQVSAQDTQNFRFSSFSAEYYLDRNQEKTATLKVVETLVAEFPDYNQNHGILRAIPKEYQDHTLSLVVQSINDSSGQSWDYTTYEENNNLVLKIGDADTYVKGQQTYVITYTMRNIALLLENHDEFFWDVNGDQWQQPFDRVSARVYIPESLSSNLRDRQICFAGYSGQTASDKCTIEREVAGDGETVVDVNTEATLLGGQTLTFALDFDDGTFQPGPEIAREEFFRKVGIGIAVSGLVVPPLVAFGLMFGRWRKFGNDPKSRGVIVPEYQSPKGFNVVSGDFILHQTIQPKTFTAGLLQLAVSKYIRISEIQIKKKLRKDSIDYELEIVRALDGADTELSRIAKAVFPDTAIGTKIKISDITKSVTTRTDIAKAITKLKDSMADSMTKTGFFVKNPNAVKTSYRLWSIAPFAAGGVLLFFISQLFLPAVGVGVGCLMAGIIMLVFAHIMPARTQKGVETYDALLGLKDYINLAEKDRLNFGQSPEGAEKINSGSFDPNDPKMQVKLFETLLPYAVLFGLEKKWAAQFTEIYKSPPDWYGGSISNFNTVYLAHSLTSFSSVSGISFSAPASNSSGGFSGGGSGGGGGGGGGGGW